MAKKIVTIISNSSGRIAYIRDDDKIEQVIFPLGTPDAEIYAKLETADEPDAELEQLREAAKALGIKSAHNMKRETLIEKINAAKGE